MNIFDPIEEWPIISPAYGKRLKKLGIERPRDLLFHFPVRYENFAAVKPIGELVAGETVTVQGTVRDISARVAWKNRRRFPIVEAYIEDGTGKVRAVWFNQSFMAETLEKAPEVLLSGKVQDRDGLFFSSPSYEVVREVGPIHTGRLVPVYPETAGVSSRWLRYVIEKILPLREQIEEPLPASLLKQEKLMGISEALTTIHFPSSLLKAKKARDRFVFEELLTVQLAALRARARLTKEQSPIVPTDIEATKAFIATLPFSLTDSQKKATWAILKDMEKPTPMNRLLEGDVGSGKTVVAAIVALNAVRAGYQVAFMAPTELLATQHYQSISKLFFGHNVEVTLLTRVKKDRDATFADVVVGTHALIQKKVNFSKLGLVVIDEQHRFGVAQRAHLLHAHHRPGRGPAKSGGGTPPHLLSMTATPIPRTLALTVYGDLDISLLREMPAGRKKIDTRLVAEKNRAEAFAFVRNELDAGRQAFVVFPLVEESEKLEAKAATQECERLAEGPFTQYSVGLLHGKMKPKEKDETMAAFKEKKIQVLVATSVVEVGIDVPNATVMMIENADRFGLAQLHQFRGRVGRSELQSYCFLFTDSTSSYARKRMKALISANDGFELAEYDLAFRGPGEIYGTRQSGMDDMIVSSLADRPLVEHTRAIAEDLLNADPELSNIPALAEKVARKQEAMHFE